MPAITTHVFISMSSKPHEAIPLLRECTPFYVWDEETAEVRWMTSFDTGQADVENLRHLTKEWQEGIEKRIKGVFALEMMEKRKRVVDHRDTSRRGLCSSYKAGQTMPNVAVCCLDGEC